MLRLVARRRRGTRIPCEVLEHFPIRRGSGGPQKPFSWLSEGVRGVFTIITEADEKTCIPHLHILGATMSSWVAGAGQYCLDLSLVTFVVTLGRR
jgi:hypothetical protein